MDAKEMLIEKANNQDANSIIDNYDFIRESIRHYFSRMCFDYDENNQYELDIDVEGTFGLSESEKIKYISFFEDNEGIIWFKIGGIYDEKPDEIEIDNMSIDELIYIIKELEK